HTPLSLPRPLGTPAPTPPPPTGTDRQCAIALLCPPSDRDQPIPPLSMPPSALRLASACGPGLADCTARQFLPHCNDEPSHAGFGGPSPPAARRLPDPSLPERWRSRSAGR